MKLGLFLLHASSLLQALVTLVLGTSAKKELTCSIFKSSSQEFLHPWERLPMFLEQVSSCILRCTRFSMYSSREAIPVEVSEASFESPKLIEPQAKYGQRIQNLYICGMLWRSVYGANSCKKNNRLLYLLRTRLFMAQPTCCRRLGANLVQQLCKSHGACGNGFGSPKERSREQGMNVSILGRR